MERSSGGNLSGVFPASARLSARSVKRNQDLHCADSSFVAVRETVSSAGKSSPASPVSEKWAVNVPSAV